MKKNAQKLLLPAVFLLFALLFCACSGSGGYARTESASNSASGSGSYNAAPAMDATAAEYGYYYDEPLNGGVSGGGTDSKNASALPDNAKMIYTADMRLQTTAFDEAVEKLNDTVYEMGGYFESSSLDNISAYRQADYTVRVPAEKFRDFCDRVGQICHLLSKSEDSINVGEDYYDTEARLQTQRTKLERLQNLLAEAKRMEDIITLESAISDTEYEIELLTGTLRHYDSLIGYSTVNISLREVAELTEVETPPIGFSQRLTAAFRSGTEDFTDGMKEFLIDMAMSWPSLLLLLAIVLVVVLLVRRSRKRWAKQRVEGTYPPGYAGRRPNPPKQKKWAKQPAPPQKKEEAEEDEDERGGE